MDDDWGKFACQELLICAKTTGAMRGLTGTKMGQCSTVKITIIRQQELYISEYAVSYNNDIYKWRASLFSYAVDGLN